MVVLGFGQSSLDEVQTIDGSDVTSADKFRLAREQFPGVPLLLKNAPLRGHSCFSVDTLAAEIGDTQVPQKSQKCNGFFVGDQKTSAVMAAAAKAWHPGESSFGDLVAAITAKGSSLYLSARTANRSCRRVGDVIVYNTEKEEGGNAKLLNEFVQRAPMPLLLPQDQDHVMVFWIGSKGKNFGLHTDLFTEQFLVQNEGVKEVFLLLPEEAGIVAPFPFISSEKFYKSKLRSVANVDLRRSGCLRASLGPGDILYIPPFWWHELCTISDGPSLTTTFRIHLPENKTFFGAIEAIYKLAKTAREEGNERLAKHLCSFFALGTEELPLSKRDDGLVQCLRPLAVALLILGAGYLLGHRSATHR